MIIMTPAKFHFHWLMLTLIFGIWASEPPPGPGERLKRPGLIGLKLSSLRLFMASLSEATVSVLIWSCSSILSHSLKSRSLSVPLSSVPLPSLPVVNYQWVRYNSLLLALNWFNLLWSLSFLPGDLTFRILFPMLRLPFLLAAVQGARSGFSFSKGCSFLVEPSLGLVLKSSFFNFKCLNDPLRYWSV